MKKFFPVLPSLVAKLTAVLEDSGDVRARDEASKFFGDVVERQLAEQFSKNFPAVTLRDRKDMSKYIIENVDPLRA